MVDYLATNCSFIRLGFARYIIHFVQAFALKKLNKVKLHLYAHKDKYSTYERMDFLKVNDHDLSKEEYMRVLQRFKWISDTFPIGYSVFTKTDVITTDIRMKGLEVFYHLNTYECKGTEVNGNLLNFITQHKDINCYNQSEWTDDETGVKDNVCL